MKSRIIYLIFIFFASIFHLQAQENRKFNFEEFKNKRIEFLKKEIGLTDKEAKEFFPLSDELMRKKYELNKAIRLQSRELKDKKDKTDADYEAIVQKTLDAKVKEAQLENEYYQKFKRVLSPEKLYKYQVAEMKFARNTVNDRERPKGGNHRR